MQTLLEWPGILSSWPSERRPGCYGRSKAEAVGLGMELSRRGLAQHVQSSPASKEVSPVTWTLISYLRMHGTSWTSSAWHAWPKFDSVNVSSKVISHFTELSFRGQGTHPGRMTECLECQGKQIMHRAMLRKFKSGMIILKRNIHQSSRITGMKLGALFMPSSRAWLSSEWQFFIRIGRLWALAPRAFPYPVN